MFVTFEGPEGAGKSTALKTVAANLTELGHSVVTTREPGSGKLGARIRQILLEEDAVSAETELLLFLADRANHMETIVVPALSAGQIVLCDRHADSTIVYQGYGRGLNLDFLRAGNRFATKGMIPDLTLLFDLDPEIGLARLVQRLGDANRLDREPLEFHRKVRQGFLDIAQLEPQRFVVLDAKKRSKLLADDALNAILQRQTMHTSTNTR